MPKVNKKSANTSNKQQTQMSELQRQVSGLTKKMSNMTRRQDGVTTKNDGLLSTLGRIAGPVVSGLAKIVGVGDYTVEENSIALSGSAVTSVPTFPGMKGNRIRHKECLGVITAPNTTEFRILKKFMFNPSDQFTFPWLSSFANNFTGYKVHGAAFIYESNTSEYSANPYMGTLCVGTRYDTREPDFASIVEMQNCKFSVSAKPSQSLIHPIECKDGFQPFDSWLTRRGTETNTTYGYDKCNVFVAAEGLQANTNVLGRMWITYDIELINPVSPVSANTIVPRSVMADTGGQGIFPSVITSADDPFVSLYKNWFYNTQWNSLGTGSTLDLIKQDFFVSNAPYACLMADGKFRVYKNCTIQIAWVASGTSMTQNLVNYAITVPGDGSAAVQRRSIGGPSSATSIKESNTIEVNLKTQSNDPPTTNTRYVEISITNIGGTITSTSCQVFVFY